MFQANSVKDMSLKCEPKHTQHHININKHYQISELQNTRQKFI